METGVLKGFPQSSITTMKGECLDRFLSHTVQFIILNHFAARSDVQVHLMQMKLKIETHVKFVIPWSDAKASAKEY
jgi:hypothetical protein